MKNKLSIVSALCLGVALMLAACGKGKTPAAPKAEPAAGATAQPAAAEETKPAAEEPKAETTEAQPKGGW